MDIDLCTKFNFNKKCSCHMLISLRCVIEKGLHPVLESIVRTIAATLANYDLFGNYKTDHIFVLGDPFNLSYDSHFYAVYTTILQRAMDEGIKSKGKDTQAFVMKDSLDQLLDLFKIIKPHMFDRFIKGTLCQVPGNEYVIEASGVFLSHVARNGDFKQNIHGPGNHLILIEKGRQLSTMGVMLKVSGGILFYDEDTSLVITRIRNSCSTKLKRQDILEKNSEYSVEFGYKDDSVYDLIVECKHLNYDYSLEFSLKRKTELRDPDKYLLKFRVLGEPLTLAYI